LRADEPFDRQVHPVELASDGLPVRIEEVVVGVPAGPELFGQP
jgi:hypothetical protein